VFVEQVADGVDDIVQFAFEHWTVQRYLSVADPLRVHSPGRQGPGVFEQNLPVFLDRSAGFLAPSARDPLILREFGACVQHVCESGAKTKLSMAWRT